MGRGTTEDGGGVLPLVHVRKIPSVTSASPPRYLPNFVREETDVAMTAPKFPRPFNTSTVSRTVLPDPVAACATLLPSRRTEGS